MRNERRGLTGESVQVCMRGGLAAALKTALSVSLVVLLVPVIPVMAADAATSETAEQLQKGWWGTPIETGAVTHVVINDASSDPITMTPVYDEAVLKGQAIFPSESTLDDYPAEQKRLSAAEERAVEQMRNQMGSTEDFRSAASAHDLKRASSAAQTAWSNATDEQKRAADQALLSAIAVREGVDPSEIQLLDEGSLDVAQSVAVRPEIQSTSVEVAERSSEPAWEIASFALDASKTKMTGIKGASARNGELTLRVGTAQVSVPHEALFSSQKALVKCSFRCRITYVSTGYSSESLVFSGVRYAVQDRIEGPETLRVQTPTEVRQLLSSSDSQKRSVSYNRSSQEDISVSLSVSVAGSYAYQMEIVPLFGEAALEACISDQPYRLEADQKKEIVQRANESIVQQANEALSTVGVTALPGDAVLFDGVSFDESYELAGETDRAFSIRLSRSGDADEAFASIPVKSEGSVVVRAVRSESWKDSELQLKGVTGEDLHEVEVLPRTWSDSWLRRDPMAALPGFQLAFSPECAPKDIRQFSDEVSLACGDGLCCASVWARDGSSCEVWRIEDVQYCKDSVAPALLSVEVTAKGPGLVGTEFFGRDRVDVALVADDYEGPELWGTKAASGVAIVSVSYDDSLQGQTISLENVKKTKGAYRFSIAGDADVAAEDISIRVVDRAGNALEAKGDDASGLDSAIVRLVADAHAPRIRAEWSGAELVHEKYCPGMRTLRVTIEEELFSYTRRYANDQVVFSVFRDGRLIRSVHPFDFRWRGGNEWECSMSFARDAEYRISPLIIHDVVGRSARVEGQRFVVDTTSPKVSVSFDNDDVRNGRYYAKSRTATISVQERNFSEDLIRIQPHASAGRAKRAGQPVIAGWRSNGDSHVATVLFPGEGEYELAVSGVDLARNAMEEYRSGTFVVDTVKPKIDIEGLGAAVYTGPMADAQIRLSDVNLDAKRSKAEVAKVTYGSLGTKGAAYSDAARSRVDSSTASIVSFAAPAHVRANDGVYSMIAEAVDLAGNHSEERVAWSINRFGSTYLVMGGKEMLGSYSKAAQDLHVLEVNPSGIDMQGVSVEVVHDLSARTLRRGADYQISQVKNAAWPTYRYEISKDVFVDDGEYQVILHSQTRSTNQLNENADKRSKRLLEQIDGRFELANSDAEISFAIDGMQPLARFVNVENGQFVNAASVDVEVEVRDNMALQGATVTIDGESHELTADDLRASDVHRFEVGGRNAPQQLTVVAQDLAGNQSELQSCTITVTDDVLYRITHNAPLMAGALGLLICAAACLAVLMRPSRKR